MENLDGKYLIHSPTVPHFIVFSNFDVSIIYYLPSIMFAAITAGLSLATYLSLTFKRFKQGIAIK